MTVSDKYRRDSLDGGVTWGASYQFVGTDGAAGSDANVPGYIKSTYIDSTTIKSPTIETNLLTITTPSDNNLSSGLSLSGYFNSTLYNMFKLSYFEGDGAFIHFDSPAGASANWDFSNSVFDGNIQFMGNVTFSGTTSGITATAVFG